MKYLISEDKLKKVFNKYLDEMEWEVESFHDIVVFGNGVRVFETNNDVLLIQKNFLEKIESIFGSEVGDLTLSWFNENFDWSYHPATDWDIDESELYNDDEENWNDD